MNFHIEPCRGVGELSFGITRAEVRALIGDKFVSRPASPGEPVPRDYFPSIDVATDYDPSGRLEAIEMSSDATAYLDGSDLLAMDGAEVQSFLFARDPEIAWILGSLISRRLGIGVLVSAIDEDPHARVEAVMVARKGYWDR